MEKEEFDLQRFNLTEPEFNHEENQFIYDNYEKEIEHLIGGNENINNNFNESSKQMIYNKSETLQNNLIEENREKIEFFDDSSTINKNTSEDYKNLNEDLCKNSNRENEMKILNNTDLINKTEYVNFKHEENLIFKNETQLENLNYCREQNIHQIPHYENLNGEVEEVNSYNEPKNESILITENLKDSNENFYFTDITRKTDNENNNINNPNISCESKFNNQVSNINFYQNPNIKEDLLTTKKDLNLREDQVKELIKNSSRVPIKIEIEEENLISAESRKPFDDFQIVDRDDYSKSISSFQNISYKENSNESSTGSQPKIILNNNKNIEQVENYFLNTISNYTDSNKDGFYNSPNLLNNKDDNKNFNIDYQQIKTDFLINSNEQGANLENQTNEFIDIVKIEYENRMKKIREKIEYENKRKIELRKQAFEYLSNFEKY